MEDRKQGGRPPISKENEVINVIVPSDLMRRVRNITATQGMSIAWLTRTALEKEVSRIEDSMMRKQEQQP